MLPSKSSKTVGKKPKYRPDNLFLPTEKPVEEQTTGIHQPKPEDVITEIEKSKHELKWEDLEIKGKLGAGAFGSVVKVIHQTGQVKKEYAMKKVTLEKSEQSNPKNIIAEFKALYECKCENIITMYDTFYREGNIYMVIEYMDCGSLEDVIRYCKRIPEDILSKISAQILKGLAYLHEEKGIVHRDIKPANILINSQGICKIADFGMAGMKKNKDDDGKVTQSWETFQGTYTYMSPERIRGQKHSFDSDLWAVGLSLAECALGQFPFTLKENTIWEMIKYLEESDAEPFVLPDDFSSEFKEFIFTMLKFKPKDRLTARKLLEYDFITKYANTKPSLHKWTHKEYIAKRKEAAKKK
jgi:serine/threonine protein kinase